jgi:CheY-like chemotaxis protein
MFVSIYSCFILLTRPPIESCFRSSCPIAEEKRPHSTRTGVAAGVDRPRILLVENDALERSLFATSLESAGFEVTVAGTERESLEFAAARSFDLAVLDHGLPDSSGTMIAKSLWRTWQIPFAFHGVETDDAAVIEAADIGALG